jgi:hypothetical protein
MAGGIYDFRNFEQKQLKMLKVKILFILDLFLTKSVIIISLKIFIKNMQFYAIFQSKSKSFLLFVVVFLCIPAGWESYMTPRRPMGVPRGEICRISQGVLPASNWSPGSYIWLQAARIHIFCIAIMILISHI